jgi:hypothetical protein
LALRYFTKDFQESRSGEKRALLESHIREKLSPHIMAIHSTLILYVSRVMIFMLHSSSYTFFGGTSGFEWLLEWSLLLLLQLKSNHSLRHLSAILCALIARGRE